MVSSLLKFSFEKLDSPQPYIRPLQITSKNMASFDVLLKRKSGTAGGGNQVYTVKKAYDAKPEMKAMVIYSALKQ